jgi:hypothetical protein
MTEDAMSGSGRDGVSAETLRSISTPDRVESRLGTLEFRDGAPSKATAGLLYDHLDFVHGVEAFINAFPGASVAAIRQGFLSIGVEDNSVLLFSELMDSASLFLTANCDTVYFLSFVDLTAGPMVIDCRRSAPRQESWARLMTCGSGGSPTSACRAPTGRRAAGT